MPRKKEIFTIREAELIRLFGLRYAMDGGYKE